MRDETQPRTRDEREIAGYRYVLDMIHTQHNDIPITPNVILQLHRDLFRYTGISFAGKFKDSDNVIAERSETGELVADSAQQAPPPRRSQSNGFAKNTNAKSPVRPSTRC